MMDTYTNEQKIRMKEEELGKRVDSLDRDSLPTANIMVAGGTGVGKSTLLNAIFDVDLAATGTGKPVTDHINEYQNPEIPIHIWDTVGLELDSEKTKESISSIRQTIAERADLENQFDRIHAIWYCINSGSNRYQSAELEFIKNLYSIGVPFIIVLTQCIGDESEVNAFEAQIRKINETEGMNDIDIVQVCAREFKMRGVPPIAAFGLDDLVNVTLKKLPDFIKGGFIAAQKVSEAQKRQLCEDIIYEYVQAAKEGFWDKIPLANVFSANRRIINMFTKIGAAYNTVISENSVNKIKKECNIDFENAFWGLISPIDMGYGKKVTALLETKKTEGFEVKFSSFNQSEKVARMVAFYGYVFISSIEELWKKLTEEQLKDVEFVANNLIDIINQKLEDRRTKKSKE